MLCPRCRGEFVDGVRICPDCEVDMAHEMAETTEVHRVNVLESRNPFEIDVAESLLSEEKIRYWKQGEDMVDMFAPVRLGSGYDLLMGPVSIQVEEADASRARELLEQAPEIEGVQRATAEFD